MDEYMDRVDRCLRRACRQAAKANRLVMRVIALAFLVAVAVHLGFLGYVGLRAIVGHLIASTP